MKLTATEDVAAPIDAVWARLADLPEWERRLGERLGAPLTRLPEGPIGPGTRWQGTAELKGRRVPVDFGLVAQEVPERLRLEGTLGGIDVSLDARLVALGPERTRLAVETEAQARSLAAKLALKAVQVAMGSLEGRHAKAVASYARHLEREAARA
jgi:carbon monoxide dehydrogenase subunit G